MATVIFIPVIRRRWLDNFPKDIFLHDKLGILPTIKEISPENNIIL